MRTPSLSQVSLLVLVNIDVKPSLIILLYLFTGGRDDNLNAVDQIIEYNPGRDQWNTIGAMDTARAYHGVGLVNVDYFAGCQ